MSVALLKGARLELRLSQGRTVVRLACVLGRDRHILALDRQVALHIFHTIITRHIIIAVLDDDCARHNLILIGSSIRLAACQRDAGDLVAFLETGHRHVVSDIRGVRADRSLGGTVVRVGLGLRSNLHQRLHRHRLGDRLAACAGCRGEDEGVFSCCCGFERLSVVSRGNGSSGCSRLQRPSAGHGSGVVLGACRGCGRQTEIHVDTRAFQSHINIRLPNGIQVIVRVRLVGGHLGNYNLLLATRGDSIIGTIVISKEFRVTSCIGGGHRLIRSPFLFIPSLEDVARTIIRSRNTHRLVDVQLRVIFRGIADNFTVHAHGVAIVVIPYNKSRRVDFLKLIMCHQTNCIRSVLSRDNYFMSIILMNGERATGINIHTRGCPCIIFPFLQLPIRKHISLRGSWRRLCNSSCIIQI